MSSGSRGADLVMRSLAVAGVERVFTLSGNQIMPLFDASIDEGVELIHVRHEAAAVHMADAWGRLTGQPGVALVTAGPGVANAVSAMYVALAAESPLVLLSGHAPTHGVGRGAFQEMRQAELIGHVAKASWTAHDAGQLGQDVARSMRTAISGRPGPVHVALPVDLLDAVVDNFRQVVPVATDAHPSMSLLDAEDVERVFEFFSVAERPLIVAGPGGWSGTSRDAWDELLAALRIPGVRMESPRGPHDPALGDLADVLAQADRILLLGKRLDFALRFGVSPTIDADCRWFHVDSDVSALEHTSRELGSRLLGAALADALPAAQRLALAADDRDLPWRTGWADLVQNRLERRDIRHTSTVDTPGLHPADVMAVVREFLAEASESVFVADGGEFGQWAQACLSPNGTADHRVINGLSGSIGSSIPFALAAKLAHPDAQVVAVLGDGTFGFHGFEFDTAVRYDLPFIAIVGNDAGWHAEREIQRRDYGSDRLIGCDLRPTRYDETAASLGAHGEHVDRIDQLRPAMNRAAESGKPSCINVKIAPTAAPRVG
ncbi:MAG: thiamine pyrophosphate-binding protein [Planctomycetota bacterium]|nr:thiamine pyrophosphate-binding protein [Planctomycetota bacterium]